MAKIFISYRREDSQHQADRLHAALKPHVEDPDRDIFIDVDNIPFGVDFVEYLDGKVEECDAVLALIGKDWLDAINPETGIRRLDDPKDFVRIEISAALKRGIPVVPVLLDGAPVPQDSQLPDDLKPLARRNGVVVQRRTFDTDVATLVNGLPITLKPKPPEPAPPTPEPVAVAPKPKPATSAYAEDRPSGKSSSNPALYGVLAVILLGGLGAGGYLLTSSTPEPTDTAAAEEVTAAKPASDQTGGSTQPAVIVEADEDADKAAQEAAAREARLEADARAARQEALDRAEAISDLQKALQDLGYYSSGIDGEPGPGTVRAVNRFTSETGMRSISLETTDIADIKSLTSRVYSKADAARADRRADDNAWNIAKAANTISAYRAYLSQYPSGNYASSARSRINQLNTPAPFSVEQLHPDVKAAVLRARDAQRQAQQKAREAERAAIQADSDAQKARNGVSGYSLTKNSSGNSEFSGRRDSNGYLISGWQQVVAGEFKEEIYRGEFRDGKRNGVGVYEFYDGDVYSAQWSNHKGHGFGIYRFDTGQFYEGGFSASKFSGHGVYHWPNGDRFEGEWKNDERNGLGVYWKADGTVSSAGRWEDSKLVSRLSK